MCEQRKHGSVGAGAGNRPGYPTGRGKLDAGDARETSADPVLPGLPGGGLIDRPQLSDELIDELLGDARTAQEIAGPDGLLGQLTRRLLERALEAEITEHVGYERGQAPPGGTGNARNGRPAKTVLTDRGPVRVRSPRDRNGTFEPQIVAKRQTRWVGFDDRVIALYARGLTVRDIQAHLAEIYGTQVSPDLISRISDAVLDDVKAWQTRPLDAVYSIVYLQARGEQTITIETTLAWVTLPGGSPSWRAMRLGAVRGFAGYLQALDPAHEVAPADLAPDPPRRATPYLYRDGEIAALMAATTSLRGELRQATHRTLIGLLAITGMRVGEAIGLDRDDVDLAHGALTIRAAKHGKTRELPVHPSTTAALGKYMRLRDRLCPQPQTSAALISPAGTRLIYCNVHSTFRQLRDDVGLKPRSPSCRPRIHDFRHAFAVRAVLDWYRAGLDIAPRMPLLSTYLGHVHPKDTYWYLTAAPELLALAAERLHRADQGDRP